MDSIENQEVAQGATMTGCHALQWEPGTAGVSPAVPKAKVNNGHALHSGGKI
jgi:hypothetical protein